MLRLVRDVPQGTSRLPRARVLSHLVASGLLAFAGSAYSQSASAPLDAQAPAQSMAADAGTKACRCIPAGTIVALEITESLVSDERKTGDAFGFKLAQPIVLDGVELIPAGTSGVGEIVHAAPARASGKAGELIVAARHLDWQGTRIPLRGTKLGGAGSDRSGMVAGVAVAAGVFALFIHGGQMQIPAGTAAHAKLAQALPMPPLSDAASAASVSSAKE